MANKIFVSYRREDSAGNALGISQYLEREFGRKNVFIDIDLRAGARFPIVLEQRLRECGVVLVLIGPHWLEARDADGNRRLDNSDDWVRLEISSALKREITVIPVLVGGATLPPKAALPADISGLLDHQAVSVSNTGFRSDMAGLVRDIRPVQSKKIWVGIALACSTAGVLGLLLFGALPVDWTTRFSSGAKSPETDGPKKPPETDGPNMKGWTMYDYVASSKISHFMKLDTVRILPDRTFVERRRLMQPDSDPKIPDAYYDQVILVFDCKNPRVATAEASTYSKSGKLLEHFKWRDAQSMDLSVGSAIVPGSIGETGHHLLCSGELHRPLVAAPLDLAARRWTALSDATGSDAETFYDPSSLTRTLDGNVRSTILTRLFSDASTTRLFPNIHPSLPAAYRFTAQRVLMNCKENKVTSLKLEAYNNSDDLIYVKAQKTPGSETIVEGSPLGSLKRILCK
jgi:hypothetical protein